MSDRAEILSTKQVLQALGILTLVAFLTMFPTTLTCFDGYGRTIAGRMSLLGSWSEQVRRRLYLLTMPVLMVVSLVVMTFLSPA